MKLVCLASGRGSNFKAIADAVARGTIARAEIIALITNNPQAPAISLAQEKGIEVQVIPSKEYFSDPKRGKSAYEQNLLSQLRRLKPDYVCLAGYMLLLGREIIEHFPNRILNIHPSLLPAFRGLRAQKQALDYGVQWTGCSVHFVTEELDGGPILLQSALRVESGDTEESLSQRLLPLEHESYVEALRRLSLYPHRIEGRKVVWG